MKITNAWIDDPTLQGRYEKPELCVEVTEAPDVTIAPESFAGGWTVGKFGPFVQFTAPSGADAGDFNVRFRNRFPVVVDIRLFIGEDDDNGMSGFTLPLSRARQLVRKYDPGWRLLISDRAAEHGSFLWLPIETGATCRFWLGDKCCGDRPTRNIRVNNVDLAMCEVHVKEHNDKFAARRTERAS